MAFKISLDSDHVFRIKGGESYHNQFLLKLIGEPPDEGATQRHVDP